MDKAEFTFSVFTVTVCSPLTSSPPLGIKGGKSKCISLRQWCLFNILKDCIRLDLASIDPNKCLKNDILSQKLHGKSKRKKKLKAKQNKKLSKRQCALKK